jgi:hypothetical protein
MTMWPNKSPEPTAVDAVSSAVAVHVASRRWLSFGSLGALAFEHDEDTKYTVHIIGGRPEGYVVDFHRADDSILVGSGVDVSGNLAQSFDRFVGHGVFRHCFISFIFGCAWYSVSVGALLS